jgi:hypothetical protein
MGGQASQKEPNATSLPSCGIIRAVNSSECLESAPGDRVETPLTGHWIGLRARLASPFWGWLGGWSVLCGALASNHLRWEGDLLLSLVLVLLLAELAWSSLWDLAVGTHWFQPLAEKWPPSEPARLVSLPYTQPHAPGGRLARGLGRLTQWWRDAFWPDAGPALLGLLGAVVLTSVLAYFLPARLRPLYAGLVALIGLGMALRQRDKEPLGAAALVRVGLCWLAGYATFAEAGVVPVVLGLAFSLAAWGNLRIAAGLSRGLWLLNGGQIIAVLVLLVLKLPVAAGIAGLLLFGQVAMQPALRVAGDKAVALTVSRRTWPWLLVTMLLLALTVP